MLSFDVQWHRVCQLHHSVDTDMVPVSKSVSWFVPDLFTPGTKGPLLSPRWVSAVPPPGAGSAALQGSLCPRWWLSTELVLCPPFPPCHLKTVATVTKTEGLTVSVIKPVFRLPPEGIFFLQVQTPIPRLAWRRSTGPFSPFPTSSAGTLPPKPPPTQSFDNRQHLGACTPTFQKGLALLETHFRLRLWYPPKIMILTYVLKLFI